MKVTQLFIFIALFCSIKSGLKGFTAKSCNDFYGTTEEKQGFSKDFCRSLAVDGYKKCCMMKYRKSDGKTYYNCIELTASEFNKIDDTIDYYEKASTISTIDIKSLECDSSSYLYGSLLLLLVFLF